MRCRKARLIIHLNREGEVAPERMQAAREHAAACPRCSAELARIAGADKMIDGLRNASPLLMDEASMTLWIMRGIEAERFSSSRALMSEHAYNRLRLASALAIAAVVIFFFVQTYQDARALEALEVRLAQTATNSATETTIVPGSEELRQSALRAERLLNEDGGRLQAAYPFRNTVGALLDIMRQGASENSTEMERLRARYPELWTISLEDGLDQRERAILATEGRAFLSDVQMLVNLAEPLHEK